MRRTKVVPRSKALRPLGRGLFALTEVSAVAAPLRIGILMARLRVEEKILLEQLERRGVEIIRIDDREIQLDLHQPWSNCDVVLERAINHLRSLYALRILNDWGVPTVNTYEVANNCGDKLFTSSALIRAGVPSPRVVMAFTPEAATEA